MNPGSASNATLVFQPTALSLGLSIGFVLIVLVLAILGWRRSGRRRGVAWLECLRVLIAVAIAITLNQPEWRERFLPDHLPTFAVLRDVSHSMETRDVTDPARPGADAGTRAEAAGPLADPALWTALSGRLDLVFDTFSSTLDPADQGTDLNGALAKVLEAHPRLRGVLLISDGDWNTGGAPSQAATRLRVRGAPVFTVPVGSESRLPDIELTSFDVPAYGVAGKPLRVPFAIESSLPREQPVTIEMSSSTGELVTKDLVLPAMGRLQDTLVWNPGATGDVTLKLSIPVVGGDRFPANNVLEAPVAIRKEELRVLVIESTPRWEFRYLRNALERDPGVEVNCVLFHPGLGKMGDGRGYLEAFPPSDKLPFYDVVFVGDVGVQEGQLTTDEATALARLVRDQASGLVFLPGFHGYQSSFAGTALDELYPVVLDTAQTRGWGSASPGRYALTELGMRSLLTKLEDTDAESARVWAGLPGFQWYAPALRAKAGTEILATHSSESTRFGRVPLLVTKTFGAGKILFMGSDGAWRWRRGVEDKYHYRFWGQVVRWMAYQRGMAQGDSLRLFYSPDRPRTGDVLTLNANAMSPGGEPLREGSVVAQIATPSGKTSTVRFSPAGEEAWGLFTGGFTPTEPGEHRIQLSCAENASTLETTVSVQGSSREKLGQPARLDVLREIALLTRGQLIEKPDPASVLAAVSALPDPEPEERRFLLWAHPLWAGFVLLLLAVFWIGRKLAGTF